MVKIVRVSKFLGYFKLETGGSILAWIDFIASVIGAILFIYAFSKIAFADCNDEDVKSLLENICEIGAGLIKVVFLIVTVLTIVMAIIGYLCIRGKSKNHEHVKYLMIIYLIAAVVLFLPTFTFVTEDVIFGIACLVIFGYFAIVLYSLYSLLREEHERSHSAEYQLAEAPAEANHP